jgi:L-ascorbate metabolism protein UlaG (beta-lactamase superfamily)
MTYQEAADLAGALRPGLTIPAHYEMFASNSQDPQPFIDYMKVKYPHLRTALPAHGERLLYARA